MTVHAHIQRRTHHHIRADELSKSWLNVFGNVAKVHQSAKNCVHKLFLSYLKNTFVTFQEEILEKRHLCASDKVKNQSFLSLRLQVRRATFQPVLQD